MQGILGYRKMGQGFDVFHGYEGKSRMQEFVPDRRNEVETDDEENESEIHCDAMDNEDDEIGSDSELISAQENPSFITSLQSQNCAIEPWPQTYTFY
ncbi:hypothetical protein L1887_14353 [Cichorium endivia]|nr:hypothetical protein L1887_14353 [Cichorium endivia]